MTNGGVAPANPDGGWLRDLIRPPFRNFSIDTQLSESEVVERLRSIVEPGNVVLAGLGSTNKLFAGEVSSAGFKIVRLIYFSNGFRPVIVGRFENGTNGTRVQVVMNPKLLVRIFATLWFGLLTLFLVIALLAGIFSRKGTIGDALAFVGFGGAMGAIAYLLVAASFGAEARKSRGLLEEALQATPGPRVQSVLTAAPLRVPRIVKRLLLGVGVLAIPIALVVVGTPYYFAKSEPYEVAKEFVQSDPVIQGELGTIIRVELKRLGIAFHYAGSEGDAKFALTIEGTRGKGVVPVAMRKHLGIWHILTADLREPSGRIVTLQADTAAATTPPSP